MKEILENETALFRLKIVLQVLNGDKTISEISREIRRSRNTVRKWVKDYERENIFGLKNKPRGSQTPLDSDTKELIIEFKQKNRSRSARKIRDILEKEYQIKVHRQTVWRVLKSAGENKKEKKQLKPDKDFEYPYPNDCWQIDIMDGIHFKETGMVYLHLIIDDHSRNTVAGEFFKSRGANHTFRVMREAFEENGMPKRMLADRATNFKSALGKGLTRYERILKVLGIQSMFSSPGHPKSRGKIERLFGFIQEDFLSEHRFTGLEDLNAKFKEWMEWYSKEHKHSSLNDQTPFERYNGVNKRFSELDLDDVFCEYYRRKVRKNATVSFRKNIYPVDPKSIGEYVELRLFDERVRIFKGEEMLGTYDSSIDYKAKHLRRVHNRKVKKNGRIKFQNFWYLIGQDYIGKQVEVIRVRDQIRIFLPGNKQIIFKSNESQGGYEV